MITIKNMGDVDLYDNGIANYRIKVKNLSSLHEMQYFSTSWLFWKIVWKIKKYQLLIVYTLIALYIFVKTHIFII